MRVRADDAAERITVELTFAEAKVLRLVALSLLPTIGETTDWAGLLGRYAPEGRRFAVALADRLESGLHACGQDPLRLTTPLAPKGE